MRAGILEFESRNGEGQGSLARCSPWGCRVGLDLVTEQQVGLQSHALALARRTLTGFSVV